MKKSLLITSLLLVMLTASPALAQESSSSSESLKDRLQKVIDENRDQIAGVVEEGQEKRGIVGTVKRVSEESITIEGPKGTLIIPVEKSLAILQNNAPLPINSMEIDSQVVLIGYQSGDDFEARRVLVLKSPLRSVTKSVTVGNITKIDKTSVSLKTRGGEDKIFEIQTSMVVEDNKGEVIKIAEVEEGQDILIISTPVETSARKVKDSVGKITRLHLLAEKAEVESDREEVKPTAVPKSSAKPTATPKASVTPRATAKPTATPKASPTKAP